MFNFGIIELLVIFFFVVLFVKPEDLPKISKNIGLLYRKICKYFYNFKYELNNLDINSEIEENIIKQNNKKKKRKRIK